MNKIGFAGSFDVFTEGHLWVVKEAAKIAPKVLVMVAGNPAKQSGWFSLHDRVDMIQHVMRDEQLDDKVEVAHVTNDYVAHFAEDNGCDYLIRGIRSSTEFDYENLIQQTNETLLESIPTLFVMPPRDLASVSSSFVKGLVGSSTWWYRVKKLLPASVYKEVLVHFLKMRFDRMNKTVNCAARYWFSEIIETYSEPHRAYHNLEHLVHCFTELERISTYTAEGDDLLLAIFMHDFVYEPGVKNELTDEEASAQRALRIHDGYIGQHAAEIIRRTAHLTSSADSSDDADNREAKKNNVLVNRSSDMMNDIDLSILGSRPEVYHYYSEGIAREYNQHNRESDEYLKGRHAALGKLLALADKGILYKTPQFATHHKQAIANMRSERIGLAFTYNNRQMRADGDFLK